MISDLKIHSWAASSIWTTSSLIAGFSHSAGKHMFQVISKSNRIISPNTFVHHETLNWNHLPVELMQMMHHDAPINVSQTDAFRSCRIFSCLPAVEKTQDAPSILLGPLLLSERILPYYPLPRHCWRWKLPFCQGGMLVSYVSWRDSHSETQSPSRMPVVQ